MRSRSDRRAFPGSVPSVHPHGASATPAEDRSNRCYCSESDEYGHRMTEATVRCLQSVEWRCRPPSPGDCLAVLCKLITPFTDRWQQRVMDDLVSQLRLLGGRRGHHAHEPCLGEVIK